MSMQAMAASSYGPLQRLKAISIPRPEPGAGEVRVRVQASALNPADYKVILGKMKFLHGRKFPLVVGYDFSGTIDALGSSVSNFAVGDDVFGFLPYGPGNNRGAFAEALIAKVAELARKPAGISHTVAAAAATPGLTAILSLRDLGRLPPSGGRVLITGASGGVGSLAIGIARKLGASVTAVGSGRGLELAKRLGAESVIDRKANDFMRAAKGLFDVVFDAAAASCWGQWKSLLKPGGRFVTTLPTFAFAIDKVASLFSSTGIRLVMVKSRSSDLDLLGKWLTSGLEVPLDATVPVLNVAEALARLERGDVVGRIAVDVAGGF